MTQKDALHKRFSEIVKNADAAGRAAVAAMRPVPMVVGTPRNMMASLMGGDDGGFDPDQPTYYVADGVCGFAEVVVRSEKGPGGTEARKFEKWLKGQVASKYPARYAFGATDGERGWYERGNSVCNEPHRHYYGGTSVWVGGFNQSMQKKEAYARAFAAVVNEHVAGVSAYASSRMD